MEIPVGRGNLLEQLQHETPQQFAVARFHVHEFNARPSRRDVADHGGKLKLAKPRANFKLHGFADRQALIGFHERSPESQDANARGPAVTSRNDRLHRLLHTRAEVAARPRVCKTGFDSSALLDSSTRRRRPIFEQPKSFFGRRAQRSRFAVGQAVAHPHHPQQCGGRFRHAHSAQSFNRFDP